MTSPFTQIKLQDSSVSFLDINLWCCGLIFLISLTEKERVYLGAEAKPPSDVAGELLEYMYPLEYVIQQVTAPHSIQKLHFWHVGCQTKGHE